MLLGEYKHTLDEKGRMAIPSKFRGKVESGAIITRGLDHCLFVFGAEEWQKISEKLNNLPLAQANARAFGRFMFSGASDVEVDAQGRILVPTHLREYASLKKQVVVAGLYNRIEIWDAEVWSAYRAKTEMASDEIAEKLGEMGI